MRVKIKTIERMKSEYGISQDREEINCYKSYPLVMEQFMPEDRIIEVIWDKEDSTFRMTGVDDWVISQDMIEDFMEDDVLKGAKIILRRIARNITDCKERLAGERETTFENITTSNQESYQKGQLVILEDYHNQIERVVSKG